MITNLVLLAVMALVAVVADKLGGLREKFA